VEDEFEKLGFKNLGFHNLVFASWSFRAPVIDGQRRWVCGYHWTAVATDQWWPMASGWRIWVSGRCRL